MGLLERSLMVSIFPRKLLAELEAHTINTDLSIEDLRLLDGEHIVQLFQPLVRRESLRLHLVLVSLLVEGETIASDRRIHGRAEVGVLFDDITALGVDLHTLTRFVHLTEHLNTLALNLGQSSLFVLRFLQTDLFSPLGVFLFEVTLTLNES